MGRQRQRQGLVGRILSRALERKSVHTNVRSLADVQGCACQGAEGVLSGMCTPWSCALLVQVRVRPQAASHLLSSMVHAGTMMYNMAELRIGMALRCVACLGLSALSAMSVHQELDNECYL